MTDLFQTIGAAAAAAEIVLRLYKELSTFIENARSADRTVNDLASRMNHSRRTLQNVIIASQERKRQAEGNSLDTKGNEEQIWSNIENILQYWAKKLAEFQALVGPLDKTRDGRKTLNWGDKTLLQFKLNRMEPKMAAYENDMNKCVYWITLSLSCVKMSV